MRGITGLAAKEVLMALSPVLFSSFVDTKVHMPI